MTVRPLTDRELENALIALLDERDAQGRHTLGIERVVGQMMLHTGRFQFTLPTHEGVFL